MGSLCYTADSTIQCKCAQTCKDKEFSYSAKQQFVCFTQQYQYWLKHQSFSCQMLHMVTVLINVSVFFLIAVFCYWKLHRWEQSGSIHLWTMTAKSKTKKESQTVSQCRCVTSKKTFWIAQGDWINIAGMKILMSAAFVAFSPKPPCGCGQLQHFSKF